MNKKIVIIDCGSSKVPDIQRCIEELNEVTEIVHWSKIDENVMEAKGIVISGNPDLLTKRESNEDYLNAFAFTRTFERPILGICFGHQIIGMIHGAVVRMGQEVRTTETIDVVNSSSLFNGLREDIEMGQDHCEEINLPEGFKLVASSKSCEVEAIQHKFKPIFGVQFHPEVSGQQGLILLKNFVKTCN